MSGPSTLWAACWEGPWSLWFFRRYIHCGESSLDKSHIWSIQLLVLEKQIHSASLIFSLHHGSEPLWHSLCSPEKRFHGSRLHTASQHQSRSRLHSSSHGKTRHTRLAHPVVADCWRHNSAFWAWRAVLK